LLNGGVANLYSGTIPTSTGWTAILGAGIIVWLLMILAAARDGARLRRLGFLKTASPLWILLVPPLVYLIVRTVRVHAESRHGIAPLIFYLVSYVAFVALSVFAAVAFPAFFAAHSTVSATITDSANASNLAAGITSGLEKNDGGSFSVSCTPYAKPKTSPTDVTCIAVDLKTQTSHTLIIEVDPSTTGGAATVKLLNVTPPISSSGN
jgi:branched-subunit amino acid transport protein